MGIVRKFLQALKANFGGKRSLSLIKYIVIHYTANDGDTDEANTKYFARKVVNASAHYFVDDDSITQSVPDDYAAWSVGGSKYKNTNGGSLYGKATNSNTLNIEMCDTIKDGTYNVSEATLNNTVQLVKEKMEQYNIPLENVIRHYDVTGKLCPAYFVDESAWAAFKKRLGGSWKQDSTGWWYQNPDGSYPKSQWLELDAWYYFDDKGYAICNTWKEINGKWYYFKSDCRMATGWLQLDKQWYYLDEENGDMKTGLRIINGSTYYLAGDGHMCRTNNNGALV